MSRDILPDTALGNAVGHAVSYASGLVAVPVAGGTIVLGTLFSGAVFSSGPLVAGAAMATGFIASLAGVGLLYKGASEIVPDSNSYHMGALSAAMLGVAAYNFPYSDDNAPYTTEPARNLLVEGSCADTEIKIEAGGQKASIILPEGCVLLPQ